MSLFDVKWEPKEEGHETTRMGVRVIDGHLRVLGSYPANLGVYFSQADRFMGEPTGYLLPVAGTESDLVARATNSGLRGMEVLWAHAPDDPEPMSGTITMFDRMSG